MNALEKKNGASLDAANFVGIYLGKEDFARETVLTIVGVGEEEIPRANRKKLVVRFAECEKRLVLNTTNIKSLSTIFRSTNTALWRGPVSLYVDHEVEFAGRIIGGIRVKPALVNGATRLASNLRRDPANDGLRN